MIRRSLLVGTFVLIVTACGGGASDGDGGDSGAATTAAAAPTTTAQTTTLATTTTTQLATTTTALDPDGTAVEFNLELILTSWENGGDVGFGPEIGSVGAAGDDGPDPELNVTCFGARCTASGWFGGAGWGTRLTLAVGNGGSLSATEVTPQNCGGAEVGTSTLTVDLTIDFSSGSVAGELVRESSILESGDCSYSSETRSIAGSVTERGTCIELSPAETCFPFLAGEDLASHFDRPPEWPAKL